jgi:hypothetical protein
MSNGCPIYAGGLASICGNYSTAVAGVEPHELLTTRVIAAVGADEPPGRAEGAN